MAIVRVAMMQRDEGTALARWIAHYAWLFGFENLTILDNGSLDPQTIAILDSAEKRGVVVRRDLNQPHDFHNKGGHFTNIIHSWDGNHDYDFALPVDCDELLAIFTEDGLSLDKTAIHAGLDALKGTDCALRIDTSLFNVPGRPGWYAPVRHFHKGFVAAKTISVCDNGQHEPRSAIRDEFKSTALTYLHDHHVPYQAWRARLKNKVSGLVDADDETALRTYLVQPYAEGAHAVEALLTTAEEYTHLYDNSVRVFIGAGSTPINFVEGPGLPTTLWNHNAYLEANPDVKKHYTIGALQHYLRDGFRENRALYPTD